MLSAIVMMAVACGSKQGKVIPRGRFAQLYASLFEADAWLEYHSSSRFQADTTNFYYPILKSYGYTVEDYRRSLDYYLGDLNRFQKIIEESTQILQKKVDELQAVVDSDNRIQEYIRTGKSAVRKQVMFDTLIAKAGFTDRVDISMDEFGRYVFNKVQEDTSFFGPRLVLADKDTSTVAAVDTVDLAPRPVHLENVDDLREQQKEQRRQRQLPLKKIREEAQL